MLPPSPEIASRPAQIAFPVAIIHLQTRVSAQIEKWTEWDDGRELACGVVDVKSFYPETAEDVAERIRLALNSVRPEKLVLNPDCGFGWSPRGMCNGKLRALAEGAAIVRRELSQG